MSAITVLKENVPHGPFTRAEVADKLNHGEITLDSLAFVEGLSQWTPLREVLAKVDGAAAPAFSPPPASVPAPAATAPSRPVSSANSPIAADYSYAVTMQPPGHLVYAGFWLRVVAFLIDFVLCFFVTFVVLFLVMIPIGLFSSAMKDNPTAVIAAGVVFYGVVLILIVLQWLYFALMESGKGQATLGKRALGLYVTDRQGNRVGFGRATGRYFGKIISGIPIYVGFMLAGWTERKQALHDMMADTLVVRRPGA